jgi:AbrB family looped-hinge helix DNA binding protein
METTIDRFGRVVIPKRVREDLGLEAGESLVIEERAEGILLRPTREATGLKRKGRVLVFSGEATGDPVDLVQNLRDERLHKLVGRGRR